MLVPLFGLVGIVLLVPVPLLGRVLLPLLGKVLLPLLPVPVPLFGLVVLVPLPGIVLLPLSGTVIRIIWNSTVGLIKKLQINITQTAIYKIIFT